MTRLAAQEGVPLVVDLTNVTIASWENLWEALTGPCGLPDWFGRNLDAWNDAFGEGGISETLEAHSTLLIRVTDEGLFAADCPEGRQFIETTELTGQGRVEVVKRP